VGLDGFTSTTVEQDGTLDWCFQGVATYFTWYEMYPAGTIEVGKTLRPGDAITASVIRKGTAYTLAVTDSGHPGNSFTHDATCAARTCLDTSAEWIAERPAFRVGVAPLADYVSWTLTGGAETAAGVNGTITSYPGCYQLKMIDATGTYPLSTASATSGGASFTTTWHDSY